MCPTRSRRPGVKVVSLDYLGDGSNDAWWGTARALVKPASVSHPYLALNEFVAARLCSALGLPVPMGDVGEVPNTGAAWVSAQVALSGQEVAPVAPEVIVASYPYLVAGIVVFDVWVNNVDRHEENLIFHPDLGLWMIDHDQCLAGTQTDLVTTLRGSRAMSTKSWAFEADHVKQGHAGEWIKRIQTCGGPAIEHVLNTVRERHLATAEEADAIRVFLSYRAGKLGDLVGRSLGWGDATDGSSGVEGDAGEGTLWKSPGT